ncbi:hypothetical protein [Nostoc sp.]|uniref:hypothetical protein n=1 Tax=Nostoc sp. TaxID=1180 RepID=UPI002FF8F588
MENLEANSKPIHPESENPGRNKTNSQGSEGDHAPNHPSHPEDPQLLHLIEAEEHKSIMSASVSNPPEEDETNNPYLVLDDRINIQKTNQIYTAQAAQEHGPTNPGPPSKP